MANTMAGYMDKLSNAVSVNSGTFTAVKKRLAEIIATLKLSRGIERPVRCNHL